eukprot:10180902-Alexandrium_andersonii.AAC.1
MSASLVGSEMCIRDRSCEPRWLNGVTCEEAESRDLPGDTKARASREASTCLLYTSDAADDM